MTIALACGYALAMLILVVAFLVAWIRNYQQIRRYWKYGLAMGVILVGSDLAVLALTPSIWSTRLGICLAMDAIVFLKAVGFTMLGMSYCAWLGTPSFPLAMRWLPLVDEPDSDAMPPHENAPTSGAGPDSAEQNQAGDMVDEAAPNDPGLLAGEIDERPIRPFHAGRCIFEMGLVVVISVAYSMVLFELTSPRMSEMARKAFALQGNALETAGMVTPQMILVLVTFALGEEIIFRLGIQNFLARHLHWQGRKYWLAIFLTTCLWTLGHAGTLEPGWVKLAQIFPLGLLLGWLFRRHGVEAAIGAHALFNVIGAFLCSPLIR